MDKTYTQPLRVAKLMDELVAASITPTLLESDAQAAIESIATWARIVAPQDGAAVDAVVAAHDPNTPSGYEQQATTDETTFRQYKQQYQTLKNGIVTIKADMDQIQAGPNQPTSAQTGQALKLLAKDIEQILTGLGMLLDDVEILARRTLARTDAG